MNTGIFGQQLTLMEELKAATYSAHAQLQATPYFQALAACQLPLESYVGQLRALSIIHGVVELLLARCADQRVATVWDDDMRKLPLLLRDQRYFEPRTVADIKEAVEAVWKTEEGIRLHSIELPISLLGRLYVLEGATLGAVTLRPMVARAFLLDGEDGLAYLSSYGADVRSRWARFRDRMNALTISVEERGQIIQAANALLAELGTIVQALYPFQPESRTRVVTSINPEAGRHAIPSDEREVQASLRAADLCWQRFPYYEHRYGERGRRFARSDAAWLASLYTQSSAHILQQVKWLGGILANRGMPTVLLQIQLEILVEELAAAIPSKRSEYEKLLPAAAALRDAQAAHLAACDVKSLSDAFDLAVGPEWSARFPFTGTLLCAAFADELAGSKSAVESLRVWMTDGERFPAPWIAAVESTLARLRQWASCQGP